MIVRMKIRGPCQGQDNARPENFFRGITHRHKRLRVYDFVTKVRNKWRGFENWPIFRTQFVELNVPFLKTPKYSKKKNIERLTGELNV